MCKISRVKSRESKISIESAQLWVGEPNVARLIRVPQPTIQIATLSIHQQNLSTRERIQPKESFQFKN